MTTKPAERSMFRSRDFVYALFSGIAMCAAFPPLNLWPLVFVAPIGLVRLVRQRELPTKHRFLAIYAVGFVHWMILIQWIRLPHWTAYFGWIALSAYLAVYWPLFVFSSRALVHRWRVPFVLAIPLAWTGLEFGRSYLFTGFAMSQWAHAVAHVPELTQCAALFGGYGVTFLLMTVAACCSMPLPSRTNAESWREMAVPRFVTVAWTCMLVGTAIAYGCSNLPEDIKAAQHAEGPHAVSVALIQAVYDTEFDNDEEVGTQKSMKAFTDYVRLSKAAVEEEPDVDLVVWPESMFSTGWRHGAYFTFDDDVTDRPDLEFSREEWESILERCQQASNDSLADVASYIDRDLLVGISRLHAHGATEDRFNSAMQIDRSGKIITQYDKMHPVIFGEYVPLGNVFPWLYTLTPMQAGLTSGTTPTVMTFNEIRFCPSICFENAVPHLVRKQLSTLRNDGNEPDCLITVTNDGWFWGSSLLDVHLACGVFRAIENRKPMLIAANTGFSAWIDSHGIVWSQGPRREEGIVYATVGRFRDEISFYRRIGDWPAFTMFLISVVSLISPRPRS